MSCQHGGGIIICERKHTKITWKARHMSDIYETLLDYYEEAIDIGMDIDDAKVYAWDKFYGWQLKGKDNE